MAIATARQLLFSRERQPVDMVIGGARVIDPVEGIDAALDVTVEAGIITRIEPARATRSNLLLAPAFVDPHVHLRVPGREDEEDVQTGTRAAAAGGFCAILAMPNTDPVVDSASVLGSLIEQAELTAEVPVGFLAAITKGLAGEELTEMVELAETGAIAFTDDGRPVRSAGLMRRALQYAGAAGRVLALHEEEPTLTHGAHMHEGTVSAELGIGGYPSIGESVMATATVPFTVGSQADVSLSTTGAMIGGNDDEYTWSRLANRVYAQPPPTVNSRCACPRGLKRRLTSIRTSRLSAV